MKKMLPSTPAEVLDISTKKLRFKMNAVVKSAQILGFWKHPAKHAATSFEEMTLQDVFYWVYKCTSPITRAEKNTNKTNILMTDGSIVSLPQNFTKVHSLTIGAAGDILQAEGLENSKDILFEDIADLLFDQDISYANFESPITTQPLKKEVIGDKEAPTECCSREQFDILKGYKGKKFSVLNTANNHTFDMGIEGIETTLKTFKDEGILDVGTNNNLEEYGCGKILTVKGIKVGFVSATFGLNGHTMPESETYRVNTAKLLSKFVDPELDLLKRQVDHCKSQNCDFILASMHWGYEFEFFPRQKQVKAARELIEYGADTIICHHPHVVQPIEYYRTTRDNDRVAIIAYSLGSLTWGYTAPHLVLSAILNFTLVKGINQGQQKTYIKESNVTPIFRSVTNSAGNIITRLKKLDQYSNENNSHKNNYLEKIQKYSNQILKASSQKI